MKTAINVQSMQSSTGYAQLDVVRNAIVMHDAGYMLAC